MENSEFNRRLEDDSDALGASEAQIPSWILLCSSSQLGHAWAEESATLTNPDGPVHLSTIWGTKDQRWHRGHVLLQSEAPVVPSHSRDSMVAVSSISGIDRLYVTVGLEETMTPPRKPDNSPRQDIHIDLPKTEATTSWIFSNQHLQQHTDLTEEAATILTSVPP